MATNRITYTLDFKANFKDVQGQLSSLRQSLDALAAMKFDPLVSGKSSIEAASAAALKLQGHLKKALDPSTGKLDLSRLQVQMKASGDSAKQLGLNLLQGGKQGAEAFLQVGNAIVNAQKPMHRFSTLSKELWTTLKNTARWQISSSILIGLTSSLSNSLTFAKELDKSLNDIRIVTGDSREQMEQFAIAANKTAKALSTTTKSVSDATLIYRQQGDSAEEAAKKAEITIKAANASRAEAQEMSEYLTGIWNSYQVGAENLELFADKLVKVGAVTATSSEELATSMTKVAATANTVGVTYDQLLSTIATVSSATRTSAETIGTAFKTIYARMGDLELKGSIDEDGVTTTLGTVSSQLKQVGVNVLDANGNIRDMGLVIEDLGTKWQTMNLNQQTAIAEAVAGKRQYTQLFALFDNWDEYQKTLEGAADAQGELNKQQDIFADSIEGAQKRLKAAKEDFLLKGVSGEFIQDTIEGLAVVVESLDSAVEAADGLMPILVTVGGYLMQKFAPQIATSLTDMWGGFLSSIGKGETRAQQLRRELEEVFSVARQNSAIMSNPVSKGQLDIMEQQNKLQIEMSEKLKKYTSIQRESYNIQKQMVDLAGQDSINVATDNYKKSKNLAEENLRSVGLSSETIDLSQTQNALDSQSWNTFSTTLKEINPNLDITKASIKDVIIALQDMNISDEAFSNLVGGADLSKVSLKELINSQVDEKESLMSLEQAYEKYKQNLAELPGRIEQETNARAKNISSLQKETENLTNLINARTRAQQKLNQANKANDEYQTKKQQDIERISTELDTASTRTTKKGTSVTKGFGVGKAESKKVGSTIENIKQGIINPEEIQEVITILDGAEDSAKQTAQAIKKALQEALNIDSEQEKFSSDIKQAEDSVNNLNDKIDKSEGKIKGYKDELSKGNTFKVNTEDALRFAGGITQIGMSASMAASSLSSLFDPEASGMDRFMAAIMLLSSAVSTMQAITALQETETFKLIGTKIKETLATEALAKSERDLAKAKRDAASASTQESVASDKATGSKMAETVTNNAGGGASKTGLLSKAGGIVKSIAPKLIKAAPWVAAAVVVVSAIRKIDEALSQGEQDARKFEQAMMKIEDLEGTITTLEEENNSLSTLSEKLNDATTSARNLVSVGEELNEVLGTQFNLLNSTDLAKAKTLVDSRIVSNEKELEQARKDLLEQQTIAASTVTMESEEVWWAWDSKNTLSNDEAQRAVKEYQSWSEERKAQFRQGKLGNETINVGGESGIEEIGYQALAEYMQKAEEQNAKMVSQFLATVKTPYNDLVEKAEKEFHKLGATSDETQAFLTSYVEQSDAIRAAFENMDEEALEKALNSMDIPEDMDDEFLDYKNKAIAELRDISGKSKTSDENTSDAKRIYDATTTFRSQQDDVRNLMSTYIENQGLTYDQIADFIKDVSESWNLSSEQAEKLTQDLLSANSISEVGKIVSQLSIQKILSSKEIKEQLKEGDTKELERVLSEEGIINAKQIATEMKRTEQYISSMNTEAKELVKSHKMWSSKGGFTLSDTAVSTMKSQLSTLQTEYGYTKQAAEALVIQENIFNNNDLTVDQKIGALKAYANQLGVVSSAYSGMINGILGNIDVSKVKSEDLTKYGFKYENGKLIDSKSGKEVDSDAYSLALAQTATEVQIQKDYYTQISNTAKKQRDKLIKDYNKDIAKWEKENALAKVEDRISEFQHFLAVKNRQIESLEWKLDMLGDSDTVEGYMEKAELLAEKSSMITSQFNELASMNPTSAAEASAIASEMESLYSEWMSVQLQIREAEESLSTKAAEELTELIEKQHELVTATLEAMKKILEINAEQETAFSDQKRRGALLQLIGSTLDDTTEYEKENAKRLKAQKNLNKELIAEEQRMQDEVNEIALQALQDGIKERQAERNQELQDIKDAFNETMTTIEATISDAASRIKDVLDPILEEIRAIYEFANSGVEGAFTSITPGKETMTFTSSEKQDIDLKDLSRTGKYKVTASNKNGVWIAGLDQDGNVIDVFKFSGGESNLKKGQEVNVGDTVMSGTKVSLQKIGKESYARHAKYINANYSEAKLDNWGEDFAGFQQSLYGYNKETNAKKISSVNVSKTSYGSEDYQLRITLGDGSKYTIYGIKEDMEDLAKDYKVGTNFTQDDHKIIENLPWDKDDLPAFASGSDSTPAGDAFVGEKGRELILLPNGKIVIAGQDGIELANLPQGARVLTNEETERILKNKKDYANLIMSHTGNDKVYEAYAEGTEPSLTSEDFLLDTEDLTAEFYKEELEKQIAQNEAIKKSLDERNDDVYKSDLAHQENLLKTENTYNAKIEKAAKASGDKIESNADETNRILVSGTTITKSTMESLINNMKFTLPRVDSADFIQSMDAAIKGVFEEVNAERDESGNKVSGTSSSSSSSRSSQGEGGSLEEAGTGISSNGHDVRIGKGVTQYDEWFIKYGNQYGVPPELLKAVAAEESGVGTNKKAMTSNNSYGAGGLMQFIDSTANSFGIDKWDPEDAIKGAAQYLSAEKARLGTWEGALSAYSGYGTNTDNKYVRGIMEALGPNFSGTGETINKKFTGSFVDLLTLIAKEGVKSVVQSMSNDLSYDSLTEKELLSSLTSTNGWINPTTEGRITSTFGNRINPVTGKQSFHAGTDIAAASGTPLYATKSGTIITNSFDEGGYGNWVQIKTDDGYIIGYGHMLNASSFKVGDKIQQGQVIGYVGNTGRSTGSHVDYHITKDGKKIDSKQFLTGYAIGGTTKSGKALVGEYGKEIILYPDGTAGLLGVNGIEYADLPEGAQIIPADETAKILGNSVNYRDGAKPISAFANGTEKEITMEEINQKLANGGYVVTYSKAPELYPTTENEFGVQEYTPYTPGLHEEIDWEALGYILTYVGLTSWGEEVWIVESPPNPHAEEIHLENLKRLNEKEEYQLKLEDALAKQWGVWDYPEDTNGSIDYTESKPLYTELEMFPGAPLKNLVTVGANRADRLGYGVAGLEGVVGANRQQPDMLELQEDGTFKQVRSDGTQAVFLQIENGAVGKALYDAGLIETKDNDVLITDNLFAGDYLQMAKWLVEDVEKIMKVLEEAGLDKTVEYYRLQSLKEQANSTIYWHETNEYVGKVLDILKNGDAAKAFWSFSKEVNKGTQENYDREIIDRYTRFGSEERLILNLTNEIDQGQRKSEDDTTPMTDEERVQADRYGLAYALTTKEVYDILKPLNRWWYDVQDLHPTYMEVKGEQKAGWDAYYLEYYNKIKNGEPITKQMIIDYYANRPYNNTNEAAIASALSGAQKFDLEMQLFGETLKDIDFSDYLYPQILNSSATSSSNASGEYSQSVLEDIKKGLEALKTQTNITSLLNALEKDNLSKNDYQRLVLETAIKSYQDTSEWVDTEIQKLIEDYKRYQASGIEDLEYEKQFAEVMRNLGETVSEVAEAMEQAAEELRNIKLADLEFQQAQGQGFGRWNEENELRKSRELLDYDLINNANNAMKIYEDIQAYSESAQAYLNAWLESWNRAIEKEIKAEENIITRLEAKKTLQESLNSETNKYLDLQHDINKELASSKIKTEWFDKKTKEMMFNEKDYVALSQKISDNLEEAEQDRLKTQRQINRLSDDELYRAQYITEAYEERKKIREQELEILREELNLQKKQNALNTALLERNVRVFSGGRWRQIANVEDVAKAQEDLDETKYQIEAKNRELEQQKDINEDYNEPLRKSNEKIDELNKRMELASEKLTETLNDLNGNIDVSDTRLSAFSSVLGDVITDIIDYRGRLAMGGYDDVATSEEFVDRTILHEAIVNAIYRAKVAWEDPNASQEEKDYWNKYANDIRNLATNFFGIDIDEWWGENAATAKQLHDNVLTLQYGGESELSSDELVNIIYSAPELDKNKLYQNPYEYQRDANAIKSTYDSGLLQRTFGIWEEKDIAYFKELINAWLETKQSVEFANEMLNSLEEDTEEYNRTKGIRDIDQGINDKIFQALSERFPFLSELLTKWKDNSANDVQLALEQGGAYSGKGYSEFTERLLLSQGEFEGNRESQKSDIIRDSAFTLFELKKKAERLYRQGLTPETSTELSQVISDATAVRGTLESFGASEELLGKELNSTEYKKLLNETYGEDYFTTASEVAAEGLDTVFGKLNDTLAKYGEYIEGVYNALELVPINFAKETQTGWESFKQGIQSWTNAIGEALKQLEEAKKQNDSNNIVVETPQTNAAGTRDSKPGLSFVNEKGVEMLSTKYGQLIELNPHQKIFNNDQMNYLYDISKQGLAGMSRTVAAMTANSNTMTIDNLNIALENVTDAQSFVRELQGLTQYIRNTKTIQGSSR